MTDTKDTNGRRDRRNKRDRKDTRSGTGGDRISRVREMEARLNRIKDWLDGYVTQDIVEDVRLLSEYYQGPCGGLILKRMRPGSFQLISCEGSFRRMEFTMS